MSSGMQSRPQAGHPHQAGRAQGARRADRDDHRLRPPAARGGRGGRRRPRARRRLAPPTACSATTSTVPVTVDELLMLTRAVRRGLQTPMLIGDLPFGSYEASDEQAILTAQRFVKEAGCDAVKLEGGGASVAARPRDRPRRHPGHGPRRPDAADRHVSLGGYRAQGRTAERAAQVMQDALDLQEAGCFARRLRGDPDRGHRPGDAAHGHRRDRHRRRPAPPTARCSCCTTCSASTTATSPSSSGSSPTCAPRWCAASRAYAEAVRAREFPAPEHGYSIPPEELERLQARPPRRDVPAYDW